jgi:hypothetical protein
MNTTSPTPSASPTGLIAWLRDKLKCNPPIVLLPHRTNTGRSHHDRLVCKLLQFLESDLSLWKKSVIGAVMLGLIGLLLITFHTRQARIDELAWTNAILEAKAEAWKQSFQRQRAQYDEAKERAEIAAKEHQLLLAHSRNLEAFALETRDFLRHILQALSDEQRTTIGEIWRRILKGEDTRLLNADASFDNLSAEEILMGLRALRQAIVEGINRGTITFQAEPLEPANPQSPSIAKVDLDTTDLCQVFVAGGLTVEAAQELKRRVDIANVTVGDEAKVVAVAQQFQNLRRLPPGRRTSLLFGLQHAAAAQQIVFTTATAELLKDFAISHEVLGPMFRHNDPYVRCLR